MIYVCFLYLYTTNLLANTRKRYDLFHKLLNNIVKYLVISCCWNNMPHQMLVNYDSTKYES